jgi:hypothetical protein
MGRKNASAVATLITGFLAVLHRQRRTHDLHATELADERSQG